MKQFLHFSVCLAVITLLSACGHTRSTSLDQFNESIYKPTYASGFEIIGKKDMKSTILTIDNPWQGAKDVNTSIFIARNGEEAPANFEGQVLREEAKRIVCMSSTHIAMIDAIGEVERVVGVSGINYVSNKYIQTNKEHIGDVGYDTSVDYERLISLNPDLVLLFGVNGASGMESKLRELNIPYAYIAEYLEESPLGKAEWLIAVSELMNKRNEGEIYFQTIPKAYESLKERVSQNISERPKVMLNAPYRDSWFMPSTNSYIARLIADAGGDYIYTKNTSNRSMPIDLEEAYLLTSKAELWMNMGTISSLKELTSLHPKFANVPCVKNGLVYNNIKRMSEAGGNDYWESGLVHPDLVLRDMIKIFHPELVTEEFYYYIQLD